MKLGEVLESYRKERKLSYRDMAKEIGIHHTALFRLSEKQSAGTDAAMKLIGWLLKK